MWTRLGWTETMWQWRNLGYSSMLSRYCTSLSSVDHCTQIPVKERCPRLFQKHGTQWNTNTLAGASIKDIKWNLMSIEVVCVDWKSLKGFKRYWTELHGSTELHRTRSWPSPASWHLFHLSSHTGLAGPLRHVSHGPPRGVRCDALKDALRNLMKPRSKKIWLLLRASGYKRVYQCAWF